MFKVSGKMLHLFQCVCVLNGIMTEADRSKEEEKNLTEKKITHECVVGSSIASRQEISSDNVFESCLQEWEKKCWEMES